MPEDSSWKEERRSGMGAIVVSMAVSLGLWLALWRLLPPLAGMDAAGPRMILALKCVAVATLFCFQTRSREDEPHPLVAGFVAAARQSSVVT